ncbi:Pre-piRNA 3'-exonuclease trimmer [Blattella germanica]|nr:Pre-piRNA 3'-exonuclease trimmer [Blattella germanica]
MEEKMVEITRDNFEEKRAEIVNNIKNAVFVAIDNEFSGLLSDSELKPSIENFVVMEIGITTFQFVQEENKYLSNKYTFYIFPRSFSSIDSRFMCQASSLEFLCQNNFDFNKFVYRGVSYLNRREELQLRKELYEDLLFRHLERTVTYDDEKLVQSGCSSVAEWAASSVLGDEMSLDVATWCNGEKRLEYILHKELRQRFPNIWTFPAKGQRKSYEADRDKDTSLEDDVMDFLLGFSNIFKLLVELRKPIVGHNLLLDLMIMYNQFQEPLPTKFSVFKEKIHNMFPQIYDTKFLSFELKKFLKKEDFWESNILCDLYYYFKNGRGRFIVLFSPKIVLAEATDELQESGHIEADSKSLDAVEQFHEAGWDSYCTGYCFIKMAHIFAHITLGRFIDGRLLSSKELMAAVTSRKNRLNLIRASLPFVCLDGPDPTSSRPNWLHVEMRRFQPINIRKVAEMLASCGAVDVKPFGRYSALVAGRCPHFWRCLRVHDLQSYEQSEDAPDFQIGMAAIGSLLLFIVIA